MSVKIITKHETGGTGDEPLSTDLEKGELGVNTVDGKLWVGDGASKKLLTPSGGLVDGLADGNTLRWEDSTSEWQATSNLVVDDAGNVGVGESAPDAKLHISGSTPKIRVDATNNNNPQLQLRRVASASNWRMTNEGSTYRLQNGDDSTAWDDNYAITSAGNHFWNTTEMALVGGNVGIGDTNPDWRLTARTDETGIPIVLGVTGGTSSTTGQGASIYLAAGSGNGSRGSLITSINTSGTSNAHDLLFSTSASGSVPDEKMRITSSGAVGIGTDNPSQALDVNGSIAVSGGIFTGSDVYQYRSGAEALTWRIGDPSYVYVSLKRQADGSPLFTNASGDLALGSSGTEKMRIHSSGRVGIGSDSPDVKLSIDDGVDPGNNSSTRMLGFGGGGTNSNPVYITRVRGNLSSAIGLGFDVRNNTDGVFEAMRIDSSGNVKINTGNLELSGGGGWYQDSNTVWLRVLGTKQIYNSNATAAAFATPGDFTAGYSDMRLKTHLGTIPDALDKVCSLEGFYYERNDKAVELGYTGGERRVGLSAQDVQAVLPEVVKDAHINVDHGTDY